MTEVNKTLAFKVWSALDEGETPYKIGESGIPSIRTAQRLKSAKKGFEAGRLIQAIADAAGWTKEFVEQLHTWWLAWKNKDVVAVQPVSQYDPLIDEAKRNHFAQITAVASSLVEDLDYLNHGPNVPVWYSYHVTGRPEVTLRTEPNPMFASLRSHTTDDFPWGTYDKFKEELVSQVERAFKLSAKELDDVHSPLPKVSPNDHDAVHCRARVDVPHGFRNKGLKGAREMEFELPDSYDDVLVALNRLLLRQIVGSHCDLCPKGNS